MPSKDAPAPQRRWNIPWLALTLFAFFGLQLWLAQGVGTRVLPYSEFVRELKAHNVSELRIAGDQIEGTLARPLADGSTRFVTVRVDPALAHDLESYDVRFAGVQASGGWLAAVLSWVMPALVFVGIWIAYATSFTLMLVLQAAWYQFFWKK